MHALDVSASGPISALSTSTCTPHVVDVASTASVGAFAAALDGGPVHLLVHVAGVLPANDTLETLTAESLGRTFAVNTFGPLILTQALLPNLLRAAKDASDGPVRVAIVSSRMGSIADNATGGSYAYRASKTAVNQIGKSLAADLKDKGIVVALLHPGIVRTNLVKIERKEIWDRAVEPALAAEGLWKVLNDRYNSTQDSAKFLHREGWEIEW